MTARFIHKGKEIHTFTQDEFSEPLPKKNTYYDIGGNKYLITDFTLLDSMVLYIVK